MYARMYIRMLSTKRQYFIKCFLVVTEAAGILHIYIASQHFKNCYGLAHILSTSLKEPATAGGIRFVALAITTH